MKQIFDFLSEVKRKISFLTDKTKGFQFIKSVSKMIVPIKNRCINKKSCECYNHIENK
jgi:hypothetical protein